MEKLVLRHVSESFNKMIVLRGIDHTFHQGLHIIIGPNGIGKSTLLKIIAGLYKPDNGRIYLEGDGKPLAAATYYVPEMVPPSTTDYSVKEFLHLVGVHGDLGEILGKVGLEGEVLDRPVGRLSAGMKRKLLIASSIALSGSKEVILYDEPFANLDSRSIEEIRTSY